MESIPDGSRRSLLFVPADRPERVVKAASLSVDVVILELEDGVSPDNKDVGRENAANLLAEIDFGHRETAVRINRISNSYGLSDMLALANWPRKPDLIILPKVESAAEIRLYDELMSNSNIASRLLVLIESSRGLLNAGKIASVCKRTAGIMFGIVDLAAELGCDLSWETMAGRRSSLIESGGFAGIPVYDAPNINIKNKNDLQDECTKARSFGFSGKLCIHPSQLDIVNSVFSPTEDEINQAIEIVKAVEQHGGGVFVVNGRMVDAPVIKLARRTLLVAKQIGQLADTEK